MTRDKQIQIKVSDAEKERFEKAAEKYNLSLSAFGRLAFEYAASELPTLQVQPEDHRAADVCQSR